MEGGDDENVANLGKCFISCIFMLTNVLLYIGYNLWREMDENGPKQRQTLVVCALGKWFLKIYIVLFHAN
jgi:hypothetical protein